jgi:hypothetical protein
MGRIGREHVEWMNDVLMQVEELENIYERLS